MKRWPLVLLTAASCSSPAPVQRPAVAPVAPDAALPPAKPIAATPAKPEPVKADGPDLDAPADVGAIPDHATVTESGLAIRFLDLGTTGGLVPNPSDLVEVRYRTWTTDGKRVEPELGEQLIKSAVSNLPSGLAEGVSLMVGGQRARLWVPASLDPTQQQVGMLVHDVELIGVTRRPPPPADVAAPPAKAKKLARGVRYRILTRGRRGKRPRPTDSVTVHYSGWTTDGERFDSSLDRGKPATFGLDRVIEGWTISVSKMRVGDHWRVWIPEELAYKGQPGRPLGMLVFDIELLEVIRKPSPPRKPRNLKKAPRRAKKTKSGVRYRFLSRGKRKAARPTASSRVKVHYTGWTTDGKMFDSSVTRAQPATFPLSGVVPGFRDGILKMRVGDRARMWIPEELAYKGRAGSPAGMLIFDVELLSIEP